jgi:hypothetical protein
VKRVKGLKERAIREGERRELEERGKGGFYKRG